MARMAGLDGWPTPTNFEKKRVRTPEDFGRALQWPGINGRLPSGPFGLPHDGRASSRFGWRPTPVRPTLIFHSFINHDL